MPIIKSKPNIGIVEATDFTDTMLKNYNLSIYFLCLFVCLLLLFCGKETKNPFQKIHFRVFSA